MPAYVVEIQVDVDVLKSAFQSKIIQLIKPKKTCWDDQMKELVHGMFQRNVFANLSWQTVSNSDLATFITSTE